MMNLSMMSIARLGLVVPMLVGVSALAGCGASSDASSQGEEGTSARAILVTPSAVDLYTTRSEEFTALVGEADGSEVFTWMATCGSISPTGSTVMYTAPDLQGLCTVEATLSGTSLDARAQAVVTEIPDGTIRIRVLDAETRDPLEADIVIAQGDVTVVEVTASSLERDLEPGEYDVRVFAEGYKTMPWSTRDNYESDVNLGPNQTLTIEVRLYPDDYEPQPATSDGLRTTAEAPAG